MCFTAPVQRRGSATRSSCCSSWRSSAVDVSTKSGRCVSHTVSVTEKFAPGYRLLGLALYDAGGRSFCTRDCPVRTPEDLAGLKMYLAMLVALGLVTVIPELSLWLPRSFGHGG